VKYYTGIGSRQVPPDIYQLMVKLGERLACEGWILRSGGADGSDTAFEEGCKQCASGNMNIYLPWNGFNNRYRSDKYLVADDYTTHPAAEVIASQVHPAWDSCSKGAKALHTRNIFQIMGHTLNTPSKFVVYWAPVRKGVVQGGTATAAHFAKSGGIECFNLSIKEDRERIELWLKTKWN
jgi:hypothetical protein